MKGLYKFLTGLASALAVVFVLGTGTANALSVTWALLFPVPLPLPVWNIDHPHTLVTYGFLFPVWLPLPFYDYGSRGPIEPKFQGNADFKDLRGARVYIDGRDAGVASGYYGKDAVAALSEGPHKVELMHDGRVIYAARFEVRGGEIVNPTVDNPAAGDDGRGI